MNEKLFRYSIAALLLCVALPVAAQPALRDIQVRHNLLSSKELPKPAFVQLTWPENDSLVAVVGLGIRAGIGKATRFDTGLFAEYLRNTAASQDAVRAGLDIHWQVLALGKYPGGRSHSPLLLAQLNYKKDGVKDAVSVQAAINYTHIFQSNRLLPLPNTYYTLGDILDLTYAPYLGAELESETAGKNPDEGTTVRGVARLDVSVYPNVCAFWDDGKGICRVLEGTLQLAHRHDLISPIENGDRNHSYLEAGLNLFFVRSDDGKRRAGIGITYTKGEDPAKGFRDQKITQVVLTVLVVP